MALLALGCAAWAVDMEMNERQAIAELKQGGQVIYLRHAERYRGGPKDNLTQFSSAAEFADCRRQRNLTPAGRSQAVDLGKHLRQLGIPVGRVIANAQCRTRDTAMLAFGRAELEPRFYDVEYVRSLLNQAPSGATNTVIIGNDHQLRELTGVELDVGEMAVVKSDGHGGLRVVARLESEDWEDAADPAWWDLL